MRYSRDIIIKPHVSEKSLQEIEEDCYSFVVAKDANKREIRKAIEEIFQVEVERVNIMNRPGKKKSLGVFHGRTPDWKKAIVKLKKGTIDIFEGMM